MEHATLNWQEVSTWVALVVDDEPDNLEVVAETLEYYGATVKTAKDGLEGLAVLESYPANLILLDLSMPNMNGWEMRAHLKDNPDLAGIPVLALTAHAMAGDADRAIAAGFYGYLTKPVTIATLLNDIRASVNRATHKEQVKS